MNTIWNIVHWQLLVIDVALLTGAMVFLFLYAIDAISRGKKITKDFLAVLFEMAERRQLPSQKARDRNA
jgi:hypothetical protein